MSRHLDMSEFLKMILACAPSSRRKVGTHRLLITNNNKTVGLDKGPGIPRKPEPKYFRGVPIKWNEAAKVVQQLGVDPNCANGFFPRLDTAPRSKSHSPISMKGYARDLKTTVGIGLGSRELFGPSRNRLSIHAD